MREVGFILFLVAQPALGWVTRSQSVWGAQINEIQAMLRGEVVDRQPQSQLGYLWTQPDNVTDTRGLGGAITWAWDPKLCEHLQPLFKENIIGVNLVGCNEYKAAVARAFDKWAANNRFIKFQDVSFECMLMKKDYGPPTDPRAQPETADSHSACPLAEIWVTIIDDPAVTGRRRRLEEGKPVRRASIGPNGRPLRPEEEDPNLPPLFDEVHEYRPSGRRLDEAGGYAVATAMSHPRYAYDFRYTNGARPFYNSAASINPNPPINPDTLMPDQYYRPVVEVFAGTFSFNANPEQVCWYLDGAFCYKFHKLKQSMGSKEDAQMFVYGMTLGLMALGILFYLSIFCLICLRFTGADMVDDDGDGKHDDDEDGDGVLSLSEKLKGTMRQLSHYNPFLLTLFLMLFMVPPLLTTQIFDPCFSCYDFEAAALHEIGHFLGLGHPDNIPENWAFKDGNEAVSFAGPNPGVNSYNSEISLSVLGGNRIDETTGVSYVSPSYRLEPQTVCHQPWEYVQGGVPPFIGDELLNKIGGSAYPCREAQMEAFTQNNPKPCLREDDIEALAVMYPDCGASAQFFPVCHQVNLNIGYVRTSFYILIPTILALLAVICFNSCMHTFERREKERLHGNLADHRKKIKRLQKKNAGGGNAGIGATSARCTSTSAVDVTIAK